jgi:hypothetical protein
VPGPEYVGVLADGLGLRGAMVGVAALAGAFALLAPLAGRARTAGAPGHPDAAGRVSEASW